MAFFDDISKKLTQAGQTAAQKTKELADLAKLNAQVLEEDRKLNNCYTEIGKLYVSLHSENHEADFDELFATLKEAEEKKTSYQQQIKDIKGVVVCEKCGAEVAAGSSFCNACGTPIPVAEEAKEEDVFVDETAESESTEQPTEM